MEETLKELEENRNKQLQTLADEITDISDPSSLDKVLVHYEELEEEAQEYIRLLVDTLESRQVTWEQPWYQSDICPLTKIYKPFYRMNETAEEKFRTDKMSREEHEQIIKNWRRFVKKYNVPDKLRIFATWRNNTGRKGKINPTERARRFVTAYLARGLQRTIQQVYIYVRLFNVTLEMGNSIYNEYERKIMEVCFLHKLKNATSVLSAVLGRQHRGLTKRQHGMKIGNVEKKREKWSLERAEKLLKGILEHSELSLDELRNKSFKKDFWMKIQETMDSDYGCLYFFWYCYLHVQLFVRCDMKLNKIRRKLFILLRDSHYKFWTDIKWVEVVQYFPDGVTKSFLHKMSASIVRKHPKYIKTPLKDLANFGLDVIKSHRYTNKRLKRLKLDNEGKLVPIVYNPDQKKSTF